LTSNGIDAPLSRCVARYKRTIPLLLRWNPLETGAKVHSSERSTTMSSTNVKDVPTGVIIACPISNFEVRYVAGVGVLMRIHYVERADQLKSGERTTLQTLLAPEQAMEIEGALKKSVQGLEFGRALKRSLKQLQLPSPEPSPSLCQ
jgi:hypothetical protein